LKIVMNSLVGVEPRGRALHSVRSGLRATDECGKAYFVCNGGNDRFAILSVGNPIALFASATASLAGISAPQSGNGQSTPAIQSTASAQALQPAARDAPTRDEIVATFKTAHQTQTEIRQPPAEASFEQFQAWAAEQNAPAQVRPVQK
jgi:hypothetical protein